MGVSMCKSDKTTYYRAGLIDSGSLFHADYGCNGWRMMRGSQCARFEVHTVDGREDIYNILLLVCYKGGALWDIIQQFTYCFTVYCSNKVLLVVVSLVKSNMLIRLCYWIRRYRAY